MSIIRLILADAALELVPRDIIDHPSILKTARRRGKKPTEILLDVSLHYHAMKKLRDRHKRGRPDIVHVALLEALSSPLNIEGKLEVIIHTVSDYVIYIDPSTRIPRNYNRFVGLMEQLLIHGKVPPNTDKPLMTAVTMSFKGLMTELGVKNIILLSEEGEIVGTEDICEYAINEGTPIVIGAFPHGDFSDEVKSYAKYLFSIYHKPLDAWVVVSRILAACEKKLNVLP